MKSATGKLLLMFYLLGASCVFAQDKIEGVYLPANKRHTGISRFDNLPFTDRRKGEPDRYRAVNPNFVKKIDGRFYYQLTAKSGAKFYDANLKELGKLDSKDVEVDLAERKTKKSDDGDKPEKFVFVRNKGYISTDDLTLDLDKISSGKWFRFPLKAGDNFIYDGTGIKRGKLVVDAVKLNYGQQKNIGGESYYYAFSTKMKDDKGATVGVSGWIKASAIADGNDPQYSRETVEKMQPAATVGDKFTAYEIHAVDPAEKTVKDDKGKNVSPFGYEDGGEFISYKVLPKVSLDENVAATDYLKRSDDVINFGFNPAGVSNDTFRLEGKDRPLIFYRSGEKDATAYIDLFHPKDDKHTGEEVVGKMVFVYGYVALPDGNRWGWIPLAVLKKRD